MEVRFSGHSVYRTEYHIIWIPKYRRRILNPGVTSYLTKVLAKTLRTMPGVELVEQNIQANHLHLVLIIPPKYAVAAVVGELKQKTAKALRTKFDWLEKVYWRERVVWSPGYFVSTVGIYFAMAFSVFGEMLKLKIRGKPAQPVQLRQRYGEE